MRKKRSALPSLRTRRSPGMPETRPGPPGRGGRRSSARFACHEIPLEIPRKKVVQENPRSSQLENAVEVEVPFFQEIPREGRAEHREGERAEYSERLARREVLAEYRLQVQGGIHYGAIEHHEVKHVDEERFPAEHGDDRDLEPGGGAPERCGNQKEGADAHQEVIGAGEPVIIDRIDLHRDQIEEDSGGDEE